ncbi:hypothetical protein [Methylobacterium pseudosasicola]|uniref:GMP synthase (Glutamine-hydrolysing) n=1 Tax=Methylobacterium pseudosasicola TaxID=582667 RepID=A0A1I4F191_9HYPH|nr:hypothetical protein [Methylobacterium pseudosasicola]SFL11755.1 GMP synthase (glutamine-hydrolysing) [Methylobacterium pseudosasicola]
MREAVVIRHVAFEDLAAFADPIEQAGYTIRYRDAGIDDLTPEEASRVDLLVWCSAARSAPTRTTSTRS